MTTGKTIKVLGIAGSLRTGSLNAALLRTAGELLPEYATMETYSLANIPLYNGDIEAKGFPEPVIDFRMKIANADVLLIATPEYNYSVPGVLKNAIDWASRPPSQPFNGKPTGIIGTGGMFGTVRSQAHLKQILIALNAQFFHKPEILVTSGIKKFDANGTLTDQATRELLQQFVKGLVDWSLLFSHPK
ncbi:MAG: NAD(P)H-dependent oxidoreductase [bacterium]|nr:NAD(P)H-dependent oxidoreductase [bacterium]